MEKKQMYTVVAAAVVVIIVIVAVAWYMAGDKDRDDGAGAEDTYYFYLDGMGDISGWYQAEGDNAEVALKTALDTAGIENEISGGWASSIGGYVNGADQYFGTYVYTSNTVENAFPTYFSTSTVLNEIAGNIIYISYTTYTMDPETYVTTYALNPTTTESDMMTTGPFVDGDYRPLEYSETYYFYLDGMGDISGWYQAEGDNAEVALKTALDTAGIENEISGGWASSIGGYVNGADKYFGTYVFTANTTDNAFPTYFGQGSVLNETIGNIFYISYTTYTMDPETYVTTYALNPTTTESDMMTTGPFASA